MRNTLIVMCDRCNDIQLTPDGICPVCVQQVVYDGGKQLGSFPLAIIRGSHFKQRRKRGRSLPSPIGRHSACAVIDATESEYLTACGDVVGVGHHSVSRQPPNCKECRRELRRGK